MSDIISSLSVSLNLDAQRYQKQIDESKKKTNQLEKQLQDVQKKGQEAADALASSFQKGSEKAASSIGKIAEEIAKVRDQAIKTTSANSLASQLHGRTTNPYLKGGAGKQIKRLQNLDGSLQVFESLFGKFSGGKTNFTGSIAKAVASLSGLTNEFNKQLKNQESQLKVFNAVNAQIRARKNLLKEIAKDEQAIAKIQKVTPKYANRTDYQNYLASLNAKKRELLERTAYIDRYYNGDAYQSALRNVKRFKTARDPATKEISFVKNDVDNDRLREHDALQSALLIRNKKEAVKLQKQQTAEAQRTERAERNRLKTLERQNRLVERQIEKTERRRHYLQQDIRGGLSDVLMFGGGAFLGDRLVRGTFDSVAKLQKIESQVDTWNLNEKDRGQFDLIADKLMKASSLLSRSEALDATLAGMTSMGHFDPDTLKTVLPEAVKYAQGSKLLGYTDDTISNVIKNYFGVVEARQQTLDPEAMLKTFKTLWQVENVTGGKVTVKDFETILRNLGPGAPLMSDEGLLNLVAFAEQIKVAGHGGGGGAGAGISTVGNLIKMLQLTASGKPTSINAKKMMAELFNITPDGKMVRLLDTEGNPDETSGGITFIQAMSQFKNIAQQTMQILNASDKEIAKAGFQDKQGMWDDPVKTMGAMRGAFLRGTYLDKNGNFDEKKARRFYRDDQIDTVNKRLKNVNVLDEQKAITSLIAQMGFQHRTTTAMTTFMNPFFLKRSGYTIESAKKMKNPMEWFVEQYSKGNWNVAVQEFSASMERLGESAKPLVADFADITRSVAAFIKTVAEFNEENPLLTRMNGLLITVTSLAPAFALATMGFKRLNSAVASYKELQELKASGQFKLFAKDGTELGTTYGKQLPAYSKIDGLYSQPLAKEGNALSNFVSKTNTKLSGLYLSVTKFVGKIGGAFLRIIPMAGMIMLGIDLAKIVYDWFADIEIVVDGQTKKIGDIIDDWVERIKKKLIEVKILSTEEDKFIDSPVKEAQTNRDAIQTRINDLEAVRQAYKNSPEDLKSAFTEDPETEKAIKLKEALNRLGRNKETSGFVADVGIAFVNPSSSDIYKKFGDEIVSLTEKLEGLTRSAEEAQAKANDQKALNAKFDPIFDDYVKKNKEAVAKIKSMGIDSTYFNTKDDKKTYHYDNILDYRGWVASQTPEKEEDKKKQREELARVDALIASAYKEEQEALEKLLPQIKDNNDALLKFSDILASLIPEQLKVQGQSSLMAQKYGQAAFAQDVLTGFAKDGKGSFVKSTLGLTLPDNKHLDTLKNGQQGFKNDPEFQAKKAKEGKPPLGTTPTYYVPQNVKFLNTLQAQIDEGKANTLSLLAGQGKKGMDYARAFVLQKLLNGGLSLSNKNPQDSPYLIDKKKGLTAENVNWNVKDPDTKKTLSELAQMKYLAEQFKLAENAASKFAQSTAKAEEDYEAAADLVANGGVEKLPTAITSLNREVAKVLSQLDPKSPIYDQIKKITDEAKLNTASAELMKGTSSRMIENKNLEAERRAYGMNSTEASWTKYQVDKKQKIDNFNFEIANLETQKAEAQKQGKDISKIEEDIRKSREVFNQNMFELDQKWLRDNATAGQQLVLQWTDLSKALDDLQSEMMNGFIDMTEQMLDGNLDSWRDYAYNLLRLIRRQILQGTFAPLLSQITGMMNQGIAGFFSNDVEAMRQKAGYYQAGNTANAMLGNGFYSNFVAGNYFRTPQVNPYDTYFSPYYTHNYSSALMSDDTGAQIDYTGSINDGTAVFASSNAQTSWWNSFTTSFSEGIGGLWNSTKNFFGNFGDNMGKLSDGFLEFCGSPLESLKNAFSSASTVIGQFIMSLSSGSSGSGVGGIISGVIGAVAGAVGSAMGAPSGEFGLKGMGYDPSAASNANYFAEAGKKALSGSAWTRFAKGGVMSSNGELDLRKYASGGIANSPQLAVFGEGSMPEAYVPLPDGRSIPVSFRGNGTGESVGGNNISIVINVSNTNNTSTETQSSDATSAGKDSSDMAKLANRIKMLVRQEIVTQSRPGGLLAGA